MNAKTIILETIYKAFKNRKKVGLPPAKKGFYKDICGEWWTCCTAQGYCLLKPLHTRPHAQNGIHGKVIYLGPGDIGVPIENLDPKQVPKKYFKVLNKIR